MNREKKIGNEEKIHEEVEEHKRNPLKNRVDSIESFLLLEEVMDISSNKEIFTTNTENAGSIKESLNTEQSPKFNKKTQKNLSLNDNQFKPFLDTGQQREPKKKPTFFPDRAPFMKLEYIKEVNDINGSSEFTKNSESNNELSDKRLDKELPKQKETEAKPSPNSSPRRRNYLQKRNTVAFVSTPVSGGLFGMDPKPEKKK